MFHAKEYCAGDCFELGVDGCRTCTRETEPPPCREFLVPQTRYFSARRLVPWAALAFTRANELNRSILLDVGAAYAGAGSTFNASGACDAL
jgi:hypothetical protein